jgi:hypothetical protein
MCGSVPVAAKIRMGVFRPEFQNIRRRDLQIFRLAIDLIWGLHARIKGRQSGDHQTRVGHPGAIMSVLHFAFLVGPNFGESFLVRLLVIFDRNLCGHASHGVNRSPMTGLDAEQ